MSSFAMTKSLKRIAEIAKVDGRYKVDAYLFVQQSLAFAQLQRGQARRRHTESEDAESASMPDPHLTGQELCAAIRVYAQELYGLLAKAVLNSWGVTNTGDFGEIVYKLIDIGEMTKSEADQREDFEEVFDFAEAFQRDYKIRISEEA
jgi:uncharacterized repeat protein (TIGR04138 family)